jgi:NTP pyrophosphatase (non-canonical NTP hydrolase)
MNTKEYQQKALRTDVEDYSGFQTRLVENKDTVHKALYGFMLTTGTLDLMKKKIAYNADPIKLFQVDAEHSAALKNFENPVFLDKIAQDPKLSQLLHYIIGIATETNEMMLALTKAAITGKLDLVNVGEENGDAFWYQGLMCERLGLDMGDLMQKNIAKLEARYPEKFTQDAAVNRDLEKERNILEGA